MVECPRLTSQLASDEILAITLEWHTKQCALSAFVCACRCMCVWLATFGVAHESAYESAPQAGCVWNRHASDWHTH